MSYGMLRVEGGRRLPFFEMWQSFGVTRFWTFGDFQWPALIERLAILKRDEFYERRCPRRSHFVSDWYFDVRLSSRSFSLQHFSDVSFFDRLQRLPRVLLITLFDFARVAPDDKSFDFRNPLNTDLWETNGSVLNWSINYDFQILWTFLVAVDFIFDTGIQSRHCSVFLLLGFDAAPELCRRPLFSHFATIVQKRRAVGPFFKISIDPDHRDEWICVEFLISDDFHILHKTFSFFDIRIPNFHYRDFPSRVQNVPAIFPAEIFDFSILNYPPPTLSRRRDVSEARKKRCWIFAPIVNLHGSFFFIFSSCSLCLCDYYLLLTRTSDLPRHAFVRQPLLSYLSLPRVVLHSLQSGSHHTYWERIGTSQRRLRFQNKGALARD